MSTAPIPRRPREREQQVDSRDSLLRASILDTALELGIGSSSTVANWIFNPVEEADEDIESVLSPSLTYASTATSEESSFSTSLSSHHGQLGVGVSSNQSFGKSLNSSDPQYTHREGLSPVPEVPIQRSIHFDLSATPEPRAPSPLPPASKPRKLRKSRPDGYDSDGGYVSDSTKADKPKKGKKNKDKGDGDPTNFESDGGYLSESSKKKKEKKSRKDKGKSTDGAGTDYESDGGYLSSTSFGRGKKNKSSKSSSSALVSGDESDGGYLSEASAKTRRFFGLSPKSSKKKKSSSGSPVREVIPPVPFLPPLPLPIAEKFSRSLTPCSFDTDRSITPAPSEFTVTNRSSHDTVVSTKSSPTASSPDSPQALPNVFKDAESVRSPSIDVLATFGRRTALNDQAARRAPHPLSSSPLTPSSLPTRPVPSITLPKPKKNPSMKRTPPQISAPNTSLLSAKHTPVPLILTPPTPLTPSHHVSPPFASLPESPRVGVPDVLVTAVFDSQAVWKPTADVPRTPSPHPSASSEYIVVSPPTSPLPSPAAPPSPVSGQTLVRPHVLAYYDLPPPTPPPQGPLPTLPPEPVQSRDSNDSVEHNLIPNDHPRTHSGIIDSSSEWKQPPSLVWRPYSRSGTADDERKQSSPSPLVWTTYNRSASGSASAPATQPSSPYRSPSRANLAPPSASLNSRPSSPSTAPLFTQRIPQRGRESPFPTQPVLPRNESSELVRRTSVVLANSRSQRTTNDNGPLSLDSPQMEKERGLRQQLDAQWQPRSASALDTRRVSDEDPRQSWVDYGDDVLEPYLEPEAGQGVRPVSSDSHADIDSVLSMLRGDEDHGEAGRRSGEKAEPRSTFYFDVDEDDGSFNRYSVWSEGGRPVSILDAEKSGDAREKFVKQVEAMYQKGDIPPVPPLAPAARNGTF